MSIHKRASTRGPIWRNARRERRRQRIIKLIKCIIVSVVAGYAMATEQAALWITWPALCWGLCYGTMLADQLLAEERY